MKLFQICNGFILEDNKETFIHIIHKASKSTCKTREKQTLTDNFMDDLGAKTTNRETTDLIDLMLTDIGSGINMQKQH